MGAIGRMGTSEFDRHAERTSGEQQLIAEVLARDWAKPAQIEQALTAVREGKLQGPLNRALLDLRLINGQQADMLAEFLDKDLCIGGFQVERKLGSGAMGDVYLAVDPESGTRVAVKIIARRYADDEQFVKRFQREIESLSQLRHPNIANAVATGKHEGLPFLAMEFVNGPSLAQLLTDHGPLPQTYVLRIAIHIAQGLSYVFDKVRLVHRDIKPENILVVPASDGGGDLFVREDGAKLIDFGLARNYGEDDRLTMTGITMGTPHYMSPEQIRGSQDLDCRSDIYGLGATLFNLLTGRTPFKGGSPGAVMTAHLTDPVPDPSELVPSLNPLTSSIITTCLTKNPDDRYLSYQGFIKACEQAVEDLGEHNRDGLRLLRKPLVLNAPRPKGPRGQASGGRGAAAAPPQVRPPTGLAQPGSHRIRAGSSKVQAPSTRARRESTDHPAQDHDAHEDPFPEDGQPKSNGPATAALAKAQTDAVRQRKSRHGLDPSTIPSTASRRRQPIDSAAFHREEDAPTVGLLPRILLAVALAALVVALAMRFL